LSSQRLVAVLFAPILFVLGEIGLRIGAGDNTSAQRLTIHQLVPGLAVVIVLAAVHPVMNQDNKLYRYRGRLTAEWNFQPAVFPVGAVKFLDQTSLEGRLFNPGDWGGYILLNAYTKYPIFIDGRWLAVGEQVLRDSLVIERSQPKAFEKLDEYGIDILLVRREWATPRALREQGWVPVFLNFNAGVYLKDRPENVVNFAKCADYYRARGIPFSLPKGFDERAANAANRNWANDLLVQRKHLKRDTSVLVDGW